MHNCFLDAVNMSGGPVEARPSRIQELMVTTYPTLTTQNVKAHLQARVWAGGGRGKRALGVAGSSLGERGGGGRLWQATPHRWPHAGRGPPPGA